MRIGKNQYSIRLDLIGPNEAVNGLATNERSGGARATVTPCTHMYEYLQDQDQESSSLRLPFRTAASTGSRSPETTCLPCGFFPTRFKFEQYTGHGLASETDLVVAKI